MQMHYWTMERAAELAPCYNQQVLGVPYCYPQSPATFSRGVEEDLGKLYGFRRRDVLSSEKLIVAEESGALVGFVDLGVHKYAACHRVLTAPDFVWGDLTFCRPHALLRVPQALR